MPYTREWDESTPPGTAAAADIDTFIQNVKTDLRERIAQVIPGWVDEGEDPKRAIINSGDTASRPASADSHLGEWYWDTEDDKLYLFDGTDWVLIVDLDPETDLTPINVKAAVVNADTVPSIVMVEEKVAASLTFEVSASYDGGAGGMDINGFIDVDLSIFDGNYVLANLIQETIRTRWVSNALVDGVFNLVLDAKFVSTIGLDSIRFQVRGHRRSGDMNERNVWIGMDDYFPFLNVSTLYTIEDIGTVKFLVTLDFRAI